MTGFGKDPTNPFCKTAYRSPRNRVNRCLATAAPLRVQATARRLPTATAFPGYHRLARRPARPRTPTSAPTATALRPQRRATIDSERSGDLGRGRIDPACPVDPDVPRRTSPSATVRPTASPLRRPPNPYTTQPARSRPRPSAVSRTRSRSRSSRPGPTGCTAWAGSYDPTADHAAAPGSANHGQRHDDTTSGPASRTTSPTSTTAGSSSR